MSRMAEQALLRAILEDPDDDTPRLVYADWLEEHGQEQDQARAMFIRLQIQAATAREQEGVSEEEVSDLDDRIRRLWEECRVAWFGPFVGGSSLRICERGFLARLHVGVWAHAVQAAGRSGDPWPLGPVSCIELSFTLEGDEPGDADPELVQELPGLASWGGLRLHKLDTYEDRDVLLTLLQSAHLTNVRSFDAVGSVVGDRGIAALAEAPAGFRLRRLRLDSCGVEEAGLHRLAEDPAFSQLRELTLCEQAPDAAVARLLTSPNMGQLESLFLCSYDALGLAPLNAFRSSPSLGSLRSLTLGPGTDLVAHGLATWPGLANLRRLAFCGLGDLAEEDVRALVASPHIRALEDLRFDRCGSVPAVLAELPGLENLRHLEVDDSDLRTQTARRLRQVLRKRFGRRVTFSGSSVPGDPG